MGKRDIRECRGFIFDLDGTVYLGERLLDGADRVISKIKSQGKKTLFVSNKPIATRQSYCEKLNRLGVNVSLDEVLNSSYMMVRYLSHTHPGARLYVVGEQPFIDELTEAGFRITDDPEKVEVVVLSMDRTFDYRKLLISYRAAKRGAEIVATNPDATCPMSDGEYPDCAAIIAALEACSGRKVETIVGKPSPLMVSEAMRYMGIPAEQCAIVGDRLETDMTMGKRAGILSVLVLTGVTDRDALRSSPIQPDLVLNGIGEIEDLI